MLKSNLKEKLNKTVNDCSDFLLGKIESNQENDDFILNFLFLIEIFAQFDNEKIIQYLTNLLFNSIKETDSIKNDQVLYIRNEIKKIMKSTENEAEINYIKENFYEIDPNILNEIELKTIENAVVKMHQINDDKFLCKILRFGDDYKIKLIHYVNFEKISNEVMKIFLSSINFSMVKESILNLISVRLNLQIPLKEKIVKQKFLYHFPDAIQNSMLKQNFKDFTIFVSNKQIEINSLFATIISPRIKKYIQTDRTFSSFYLNFDSNQVDFFKEFVNSLSFFISKENFNDINQISIEKKFFDHLCQINEMIESKGINHLENFFNTLHSNEKNAFNYACWISLLICLGNFDIAKSLINSLVVSDAHKIASTDDLLTRLHHKEVLKYKDEIEVGISSEEEDFIFEHFNEFFTNIADFNDIDENLWKIISIRLSMNVCIQLD